ncbi:hypothetical protein COCSUDRAFT_67951 [Coccomyxa subellipsoidea C-169]|uniref:Uncharacterized protein n=1 Tax=Coccomyxa subellipsoidea (strain C-169) TaxID=574566 RepID=I0YKY6_COCSC|nr:hypothetical protein COCSUDRAFT_67951 [Coccomyxa subellipsoidea C-169]EIE19055.1 hypothetical protein COCSUDRAFT_67951 [Coccomyxa subellipsoidea C-169]|eukprot:XP_005643599.1 hypothetical protein COCSUDRAFT_67951 [Coccomyxa subellipsoidea C-169]
MQDESAAQRAQRAAAAVSQPAVYAAATPPVMILPEIKPAQKAAQLPKTGTAAGSEAPPAGAPPVGAAEAEEYFAAKDGLQSEPASPAHPSREEANHVQVDPGKPPAAPQEEQASFKPTEPPPAIAAQETVPASPKPPPQPPVQPSEKPAAEEKSQAAPEKAAEGARTKEEEEEQQADEYEVPPVREEPVTKHQKATEEEALRRAAATGGTPAETGEAKHAAAKEASGKIDDRQPVDEALVVSTPQAIGAGDVIPAAHEAEEHLMHGEPIRLHPPPRKAREEKRQQEQQQGTPAETGPQAQPDADFKPQRQGEVPDQWPMFSEAAASRQEQRETDWPSIEPMVTSGPERYTRVERGILDSGRDFEATGAGGSAATSEADYQHYRSPGAPQNLCHLSSFTGGGVFESFSSDVAFFDASEQIEGPTSDAPGPSSIPEQAPEPRQTSKPTIHDEDLSPEERGLMRSQELTEMRDRQAEQPPQQPPPQLPPQLPRGAASGGVQWPEGFTQQPPQRGAASGAVQWPEGFTQGMADEEMRSRERLAEMGERSKSRVDETHEKVVALAAEGLTSIEDTKSRGLSRLAALAHQQQQQQQPPPVQLTAVLVFALERRSHEEPAGLSDGEQVLNTSASGFQAGGEGGSYSKTEARQRFVNLDSQQRPVTSGGVPLPRDPGLGKAAASGPGLAAPAVRGPISPASDKSAATAVTTQEPERRRSVSLPELSSTRASLTSTPAATPESTEAKDKGPAQPDTPSSGPSALPSPFSTTAPESETSQHSARTTEALDLPTSSTAHSGTGVGKVLITPPKRETADKKGSPFKKFQKLFSGKDRGGSQEGTPRQPPTSAP